jgi:hypothetical protein
VTPNQDHPRCFVGAQYPAGRGDYCTYLIQSSCKEIFLKFGVAWATKSEMRRDPGGVGALRIAGRR